jgi:phosphatidylglycerophosphate synthase
MGKRVDHLLKPVIKRIPPWIKPNHLSFIRAPLALPVAACLWQGWHALAVFLLVVAVISDILDGPMARERQEESQTGEWLDPYADKILIMGLLLIFGWKYFPTYLLTAIFVLEFFLIIGQPIKRKLGKSAKSNEWGKRKMWFQSATVIGLAAGASWTIFSANVSLGIAVIFCAMSLNGHIRDITGKNWKLFVADSILFAIAIVAIINLLYHIYNFPW